MYFDFILQLMSLTTLQQNDSFKFKIKAFDIDTFM